MDINAPDPTLADHGATMEMLLEKAGDDPVAQGEVREWGERRLARLPVLRRFVELLRRHGVIDDSLNRVLRDFVVMQCFALATRHGLDMMDYRYRDSESGPRSALMRIDLHAVGLGGTDAAEPDDADAAGGLFPSDAAERAFLDEVSGRERLELGKMARLAVIEERYRMISLD